MPKKVPTYRPPGQPAPVQAKRDADRAYNRSRRDPTLASLYSSVRWQKFRAWVRAERVLCERCRAAGRTTVGTHVHHLVDPRDDPALALDPDNVQLLCLPCHNRTHGEQGRRPR